MVTLLTNKFMTQEVKMSDSLMLGIWNKVKIYCMNHKEPIEMEVVKNTEQIKSPFYGCTQAFPEKINPEEGPCPNRLNLDDYQGIVMKFCDAVAEFGPAADLTNYSFEYRGGRQRTKVKCLKYRDDEIILGVLNCTVLGIK